MVKDELEKILGFGVEATDNPAFGDYTANIAMAMFSKSGIPSTKSETISKIQTSNYKNPRELAEYIVAELNKLKSLKKLIEKIDIAGPGFINFWLKTDVLVDNLMQIDKQKEKYGENDAYKGKLAIVEYSSPNIAKPFGVGHLRSTIVGDSIANLLEVNGWKVMRDNHLGDWGTQFGKMIYAIKNWGDIDEIKKAESPIDELLKLYVRFHEESKVNPELEDEARAWFKRLEDGDSEARKIWQECVDISFIEFDKVYNLLGIKFSSEFNNGRGLGESFFEARMPAVIKELTEKNLLKVGEGGAKLVFFKNDEYPPLMILKKDGSTLYATRDLATDKYRKEKYNPDVIINEVGSEQGLYFRQLFELEKILGWYKVGQRVHVGHGLYLLDSKKMSTRAGKTIKLEDVLNEAIKRAYQFSRDDSRKVEDDAHPEVNKSNKFEHLLNEDEARKLAKEVGIGAIKYFDLSHHPSTNINFDWEKMFALEGNSGPYLQYTVARCNSVIQKAPTFRGESLQGDYSNLNEEELLILRSLIRFPEVIEASAALYSPNLLCNYLYDLAQKYNSFYNKFRILGIEDKSDESFRLLLTSGVGQVLKNGLKLLGIGTPEKM